MFIQVNLFVIVSNLCAKCYTFKHLLICKSKLTKKTMTIVNDTTTEQYQQNHNDNIIVMIISLKLLTPTNKNNNNE